MRKKAFFFIAVLFLIGTVSADEVYYDIEADEEEMVINTTIMMDCENQRCPTLVWTPPEDSEIIQIRDSAGEIDDYEYSQDRLNIRPNNDYRKENETYVLSFDIGREAEEIYAGLYKREFSLPSFDDVQTTGNIQVEGLLSGWTGHGVETSIEGQNLSFRSEGPVNLRAKFGTRTGNRTEYYEFFGGSPENSSIAYEVAVGTTGRSLEAKRLPVALLPDGLFNETVSSWSSGEYLSGSAQMRQGLEEEFLPVLAHETVHALNDREFNWDNTGSSYFEEGTSSYVESLVRKKLYSEKRIDKPPRELFGDTVRFDPDPDDNYYKTLPSKGSADVLWGYYQNENDFMKNWNPFESSSDYRGFGYAYSELVIKNFVARENGSVRQLYEDLDVQEEINDPEEKWGLFSRHMDMTPCKYDSREKFEACLDTINGYNYTVYSAEPEMGESEGLDIEELEVPEREEEDRSGRASELREQLDGEVDTQNFIERLLEFFWNLFRDFILFLQTELQ